jgi:hypothetical protein
MKNVLVLLAALFTTSSFAVGIGNDNPPGTGGDIRNTNFNAANADSRARAQSYAAALNRTEVSNSVSVTSAPAASPQPVTVNYNQAAVPTTTRQEIHQDAINVRSVPNVFAGNVYPTAPCMGSSTVGAAALGWGASVGTSWADDECGVRETARSFQNLGLTTDAVTVLCSSKYAAVAPVCKAQAQPK